MAVKYLLICIVLAAYFQGIEAQGERTISRGGGGRGGGGGGNTWIIYGAVSGSVIILCIGYFCCITFCCHGANQPAGVDADSKGLKTLGNEKISDEQLDQYMLEFILLAEQAKLVANLRAKQIGEQSTADVHSGNWEQMGFPQLKLETDSPTTLKDANISEETSLTSDVHSGNWEQMGSPQIKSDTASLMTSVDANVTEKTPMTSYV